MTVCTICNRRRCSLRNAAPPITYCQSMVQEQPKQYDMDYKPNLRDQIRNLQKGFRSRVEGVKNR